MSARRQLAPRIAIVACAVFVALAVRFALRMSSSTAPVSPVAGATASRAADPAPLAPPAADAERLAPTVASGAPERDAAQFLRVHVVDENGRALPDRSVALAFLSDADVQVGTGDRALTDVNGECALDATHVVGASGSWLAVSVDVPDGYVSRSWRAPLGTAHLEIALERAGRLSGHVSYGDGSVPAEGALYVHWRRDDGTLEEDNTDVIDGAYDFGARFAGRVEDIELDSPGHAYGRLDVTDFDVEPGADLRRDFVFELGSTLEFTFRDAQTREPIAGVRALGLQRDDDVSDEHGRLSLANALCAHCQVRVRFENADYAPHQIDLVGPESAQTLTLSIDLQRGSELGGVVTDPRDVPQADIRVACEQRMRPRSGRGSSLTFFETSATTDEHGRFRIRGLPVRGSFELTFSRVVQDDTRADPTVIAFEFVTLPDDAARTHWIVPDPVSIVGFVVDAHDAPAVGLQIVASAARADLARVAKSDESGRFVIADALPGTWILSTSYGSSVELAGTPILCQQQATKTIEVPPAGATHVEFRLAPPREPWPKREVRIRVVDAANGAPLVELDALQVTGVDNTVSHGWFGRIAPDAAVAVELAVGRYEIVVRKRGYAIAWQLVELEPGEGAQAIDVALEPGD